MNCKHCGLTIDAINPPYPTWIHRDLGFYCPGSGRRFTAEPQEETTSPNGGQS